MISKINLELYMKMGSDIDPQEVLVGSYNMIDYLIDKEYELLYELEYGEQFEFTGSSINLNFITNDLFDVLRPSFGDDRVSFGIVIYLDGSDTPEFWGIIDQNTLEYDTDNSEWAFTAVDPADYYMSIWGERVLPSLAGVGDPYPTIDDWFGFMIDGSLFSGVDINVGEMNRGILGYYYQSYVYPTSQNGKYPVKNYLNELQKHYGSYIYASPDKRLKFFNRMQYNTTVHHISSDIINILESGFEPNPYKAIAVSLWLNNHNDPDADFQNDGNFLILPTGKAKYVNMVFDNNIALGDWDRDLNESYPRYRFNHLDLRNSLPAQFDPFEMLKWNPVVDDTVANRYSAYKNIFDSAKIMTISADGYNYNLLDQVFLDDTSTPDVRYIITSIKKNLMNKTSILKLREDLT